MKIPQPATSEGANSKCCGREKPKTLDMPGLDFLGFVFFLIVSLNEMYAGTPGEKTNTDSSNYQMHTKITACGSEVVHERKTT